MLLSTDYGLPWWLRGKEATCNAEKSGDKGSIPGSGRTPGGEKGNSLQYSCQENPMDRVAWQATAHGVAKSQTLAPTHIGLGSTLVIFLEPDILECKVKWALESITASKASGSDRIPVGLFQILKDDAGKVLHSICQQI